MNVIYGLPLLLILLPANIADMIVYAIFYLVIETHLLNYEKHINFSSSRKKGKILSVFVCVILGIIFFVRWIPSSKVGSVAHALHLPVQLMLGIASTVLVVTSFYGVCYVINGFAQYDREHGFTNDVISYFDMHFNKIYCLMLINFPALYIVPPNNNNLFAFTIVFCSLAVGGFVIKKLFSSSYSIAFMAVLFAVGLKYR